MPAHGTHRADRSTRTVALSDLADPPALPSVPAADLLTREGLPAKASRNTRRRRRAVLVAAGALAAVGAFSVIHDNLLITHDTPAPTSPRAVPLRPPAFTPAPALSLAPAALTASIETAAGPLAAPAPAPAAHPAPAQPGFQQWIPRPALSIVNQFWNWPAR